MNRYNRQSRPHLFCVITSPLSKHLARRLKAIAAKHGAAFVGPVDIPGVDTTGWFQVEEGSLNRPIINAIKREARNILGG